METFLTSWRRHVVLLADRYRIIGPDLRGHGRSPNPSARLDLREMADETVALARSLGCDRAHVAGFSGGASVALFIAHRHLPFVKSLALVSNNYRRDRVRTDARVGFWDADRIERANPEWWRRLQTLHAIDPRRLLKWWEEEDPHRPNFTDAEIAAIDVPALVVAGDRDPIVPLDQSVALFRALPNARLAVLPGVGHLSPRLMPDAFDAIFARFLAEAEARPSAPR
jgi:pimeloyl-ACP methyl ester carboxylesterase